jgi:multiple sugar transport system permease protein
MTALAVTDRRARTSGISWEPVLFLVPAVLYLTVFSIFPLIYSLYVSLQHYDQASASFSFVGLQNYSDLLHDRRFWGALRTSAIVVAGSVTIQLVLGTALALFFNQRLRGAWFVRGALVFPMLVTPVVVGVMWRAMLNPEWGLVDTVLGALHLPIPNWFGDPATAVWTLILVDSWQWTPFVFVIVFARLQALPQDVFEAAEVDGAGRIRRLVDIVFPLLAPAIVFVAIFRGIDAFRDFALVFGLTYGGPGYATTTLSFYTFQNGFEFSQFGYASALAYVMVVLLVVATTVLFRFVSLRRGDAS